MEIIAYGVLADEEPLLHDAFARELGASHELRCLRLFLNRDTAPTAAGHEVVLSSVNDTLDADVLRALAKAGTKMIAQRSTGYNNVDLTAAAALGLTVARVSFYSPYSVAEFAWALALAVDRRIVRAAHRTREFDFRLDGLMGRDLRGRTAGVVGTGKIGVAFTRIAHGFGMRLLGWDVAENPDCLALGMEYVERERLFAEADLVSLHVPLLEDTHHLVDARMFALMKDDAILVNSSRGGLVDTDALLETLRAGRLSGVGLDVYEEEAGVFFLDKSLEVMTDERLARLMTFNNVLVTSHQAYFTRDAVGQIAETTAANVMDYLAGRTSDNTLVRPPAA
ncbi:2-hydroxyacid dehydrogenase [Streptomyces caniscabiei]|uniref:2-hydroxyacid dehydrogenase n=1 Tax=Streptomyces caniscabiei TaxID=2746961 RepID=A0A927LA31_9ACTN|nr:2-hydroxyacid dehydrogenase [Streptomyces caniscabiei]MBD9727506.1 2-hydroxyacid dehydrogenase [Streptomyces caniscabiei]MDX3512603.1 2-hydroxyacid dehydrogenase [Streptomyces caniscabiei]MDX3722128.1 2-hydroxyacid dehydrogenase [Streptomyces caniscabiei]WEO28884.1 2-hydroxyacid dehydrogenase [Streptomyces caniscabiei]